MLHNNAESSSNSKITESYFFVVLFIIVFFPYGDELIHLSYSFMYHVYPCCKVTCRVPKYREIQPSLNILNLISNPP